MKMMMMISWYITNVEMRKQQQVEEVHWKLATFLFEKIVYYKMFWINGIDWKHIQIAPLPPHAQKVF